DSFSSGMPLLVIDNHGYGLMSKDGIKRDGWLYGFARDRNGLATLTGVPDHAWWLNLEVRGQSTANYPKRPYKFELLNEFGSKTEDGLFGLKPFDEWNALAPFEWDSGYINNALAYQLSNDIGRWAAQTRLVEAFVNLDDDGLTMD